jgi:hypothetical protein
LEGAEEARSLPPDAERQAGLAPEQTLQRPRARRRGPGDLVQRVPRRGLRPDQRHGPGAARNAENREIERRKRQDGDLIEKDIQQMTLRRLRTVERLQADRAAQDLAEECRDLDRPAVGWLLELHQANAPTPCLRPD